MTEAVYSGSISDALLHLRSYIAGIPYDVITREEWDDKEARESFYKLLLYMVFPMLNSNADCECKGILGRSDVVIQTDMDVFAVELKVDDTVETALTQTESYAVKWSDDGRRVTKCGAVIDSIRRNLTHRRVVDEKIFEI